MSTRPVTGWWSAATITPRGRSPRQQGRCRSGRRAPTISAPTRVTGERKRFCSAILAAWARKSPQVAEVLPLLYLHGLSSGRLRPDADSVPRLRGRPVRGDDHPAHRPVAGRGDCVQQAPAQGHRLRLHVGQRDPPQGPPRTGQGVPAGDDRVRADGTKGLIAVADGFRESYESWADLLRSCKRRGMAAPVLAVGDGALGLLEGCVRRSPKPRNSVAGSTSVATFSPPCPSRRTRARMLPWRRSKPPRTRTTPSRAARAFEDLYGAKWPLATAKITEHLEVLLAFYDYPAEHWVHLRTTNPIESTFATVRLRQRVSKGPGSRAARVAMAFKRLCCVGRSIGMIEPTPGNQMASVSSSKALSSR